MNMFVCLFVYLSVCLSVRSLNSKTQLAELPPQSLLCLLPVAVARSSSDGVAIRNVLPVLMMTSRYHTTGPMGRIKHDVVFRRVRQVAIPVERRTTTVSGRVHQNAATGTKGETGSDS